MIIYSLSDSLESKNIDLPEIELIDTNNLTLNVCSSKGVCASKVEYESQT